MSKKPEQSMYRLCLKSGTFDKVKPSFVIKIGNKFEKKINTYFIQSDKQRYNYDLILEKSPDQDIMLHCDVGEELLGTAILKVDARKPEQPNQTISVMNAKKQKIASIDCSLKKIQKIAKKPPIIIQVIQASYTQPQNKQVQKDTQNFVVLKYGDANYQTKSVKQTIDYAPIWKQTFHSAQSQADRIFVEIWKKIDSQHNKFQGLALIDVSKALGNEKDYQIMFDKKKNGTIKVAVYQDKGDKKPVDVKINDKNFVKKRTIKVSILQTLLKDPSKKGTFVRLLTSMTDQKFQTSHSFQSSKQLGFNQSATFVVNQNEEIQARLIMNDQMEEEIARASIKVKDIYNKKYELKLLDGQQKEVGTLYLQFFDHQLDIKEQINPNLSQVAMSEPSKQSKLSKVSQKTANKLGETTEQMKARYANRVSIHDYMNQVNTVLQQGLLKIAKQRPQNPIKQLGLYLINYKKS